MVMTGRVFIRSTGSNSYSLILFHGLCKAIQEEIRTTLGIAMEINVNYPEWEDMISKLIGYILSWG